MKKGVAFFLIALRGSIIRLADQLYTLKWYWNCPLFLKCDLALFWRYLLLSPHKLCKSKWRGEYSQKPYGETPIKTLADIAALALIEKSDTVLELGCGRGRTCFWLARCIGCSVIGIDAVPDFIKRGNELAENCKVPAIEFHCSDFFEAPFERASVIYLYGTGQEDSVWIDLAIWLANLPKRPMIITVSAHLGEFSPHYSLIGQFEAEFGWGKTDVFFQRSKDKGVI